MKQCSTHKPSKNQQRINVPFSHYTTQCILIHIVIHTLDQTTDDKQTIFSPYRRYLPKQDQQTQKHPKITNTHIFVFIIFTLISKKRAHFALFSYILSYYVLYLLVPKLFSILFHIFLLTNESFISALSPFLRRSNAACALPNICKPYKT